MFSSSSLERLKTVDERLQMVMKEALRTSPIDFGIPRYGGKRTAQDQNKLYKDGLSKLDGYEKVSYHQSGKAVDIYVWIHGGASWNEDYLTILAGHILGTAKRLGIELHWGGDFDGDWNLDEGDSWDKVHFELRD